MNNRRFKYFIFLVNILAIQFSIFFLYIPSQGQDGWTACTDCCIKRVQCMLVEAQIRLVSKGGGRWHIVIPKRRYYQAEHRTLTVNCPETRLRI